MLTIYGRNIPNLGVSCSTNKNLYIDIDGKDLSEFLLLHLPVTETYIISTKGLDKFESVISAGYFNISIVEKPSQITQKYIASFISTDYNENYMKIVSKRVASLYGTSGTQVQHLADALEALRDDRAEVFSEIMSSNLFDIISSLKEISEMAVFCKSLQSNSAAYSETVKKAAKLEEALAEAERYRQLYESVRSSSSISSVKIKDLEAELEGLNTQINSRVITPEELHNNVEFKALEARLSSVTEEKLRIKKEFEEYKQDVEENYVSDGSGLMKLNQQLKEELRRLKERKISDTITSKLPIFTNSTMLRADSVLCFKEVRPTVYVNSLIAWLDASLRVYAKKNQKSYLILVVDPLADEYTERKYLKHGWSVNKAFDKMSVLVVPPLRFDTLKTTYHIDSYDILVCIDRCKVQADVFEMSKAKTYYLINTCSDISDFDLDGTKCICFADKIPAGTKSANEVPKYHIPTWSDALCTNDMHSRIGKHAKDGVFTKILEESGVYWAK